MSLFEKVVKFAALVGKLPRVTALPESVLKTQKIAAKFDAKLNKLAQLPPDPATHPNANYGPLEPKSPGKPGAAKLPPVPTNVQNALSTILVKVNQGVPLKADGLLGPQTEFAIKKYKQLLGPSVSALEGQPLYDRIIQDWRKFYEDGKKGIKPAQTLAALVQNTPNLQPAADSKEELRNKQSTPPGVK